MSTRAEQVEAEFEAWWAAMPPERANDLAACGEQIRSGLKAAVKLGYTAAATLTRDGELRDRLKKLLLDMEQDCDARAWAQDIEALMKETSDEG